MKKMRIPLSKEGFFLLAEGSLSSIPFNIVIAAVLGFNFYHHNVPIYLILLWFTGIFFLSLTRWLYSKIIIKKEYYRTHYKISLRLFLLLTLSMGILWGSSYFIFLPYINRAQEIIIILVLGGMSAGAIASLSIYLPAYYTYVLPMFLPLIAYNFLLFELDKTILAIMYSLFVIMVCITAKINAHLLHMTIKLSHEKDILIQEMTLMNLKLEKSIGEVRALSVTDCLTGLYNRRYFDMVFSQELGKAKVEKYPIHLVFIDVDNFKFINDTYGHPSGDEFLIYVADTLNRSLRNVSDMIFRLGGDEFAAILRNISATDVLQACDLIQEVFQVSNRYKNVTLSMGLISISAMNALDHQSIITAADKTLYQAKKAGKNQIISKIIN